MSALRLRSYEFRREREASWRRLQNLIARVETRGLRSLSGEELAELPQLYRGALSSLSVARAISLDRNLLDFLESLCQRSYLCVYASRRHALEVVISFFVRDLPQTVRRFRWHIFTAFLFLLVGTVAGYLVTIGDPDKFHAFVPAELAGGRSPEAATADMEESLYGGADTPTGELGAFAGFLFRHNAWIGILYFALGFAAGLPVFYFLIYNGLVVGAFLGAYRFHGLEVDAFAWLMIHGVTELLALVICSAGGLALAHALVFPGPFTRLENLARVGRKAGTLVIGGVLMLFLAGLIEGIGRQTITSMGARFTFAAVTAGVWLCYFSLAGRGQRT